MDKSIISEIFFFLETRVLSDARGEMGSVVWMKEKWFCVCTCKMSFRPEAKVLIPLFSGSFLSVIIIKSSLRCHLIRGCLSIGWQLTSGWITMWIKQGNLLSSTRPAARECKPHHDIHLAFSFSLMDSFIRPQYKIQST